MFNMYFIEHKVTSKLNVIKYKHFAPQIIASSLHAVRRLNKVSPAASLV